MHVLRAYVSKKARALSILCTLAGPVLFPENLNVSRGGAEGNIEIQGRSKQLLSVIIMLKP